MDVHIGGVTPVKQSNAVQCCHASATMVCRYGGKTVPLMPDGDAANESIWSFSPLDVLVGRFGFTAIDKGMKNPSFDAEGLGRQELT